MQDILSDQLPFLVEIHKPKLYSITFKKSFQKCINLLSFPEMKSNSLHHWSHWPLRHCHTPANHSGDPQLFQKIEMWIELLLEYICQIEKKASKTSIRKLCVRQKLKNLPIESAALVRLTDDAISHNPRMDFWITFSKWKHPTKGTSQENFVLWACFYFTR